MPTSKAAEAPRHNATTTLARAKKTSLKKPGTLPSHVAIIMDGNGRWARARKKPRHQGHLAGINVAQNVILYAIMHGIPYLTLYVFSTENWSRPQSEVMFLLNLIAGKLRQYYPFYREHKVKIVHSGCVQTLGKNIRRELDDVTEETKSFSTITLNLAFNYGGRDEIIRACNRYIKAARTGATKRKLTEKTLVNYLDQPSIPFPDLIIRTGSYKRLSNFLLWQSAYAELYFSDVLWPNWNDKNMDAALAFYKKQKRNFGALKK